MAKGNTPSTSSNDAKVLEGAKELAGHLLENGVLVSARELVCKLRTFQWYPAGSANARQSARFLALSYVYAVHVLLKRAPKTSRELAKLLQKKFGLESKAVGFVRAIVPLPSQSYKRQTVIYSDIMSIVALLERFGVPPNRMPSIAKRRSYSITDLIEMQRKYKRTNGPKRKATGPGQRKKQTHRPLKSIGDHHKLKSGDRVVAELEFRKRGWHLVNFGVLGTIPESSKHWERIAAALNQTPKAGG